MSSEKAWWVKVQTAGPLLVGTDELIPAGLAVAPEPGVDQVWLVADYPGGAGHAVLTEIGAAEVPLEHPTETRRVMALVVCLCWQEHTSSGWPGRPVPRQAVVDAYCVLRGRSDKDSALRIVGGAMNRLHGSGWLLLEQPDKASGPGQRVPADLTVRLGPRAALWTPADLVELREICRDLGPVRARALGEETT